MALLLVGILGLAIGASQASADVVIDHFTGTNVTAPPTNTGIAPTSFTNASNGPGGTWAMNFSPAVSSAVNSTLVEPAGVSGVIGFGTGSAWGRTTTFVAPTNGPVSGTNGVNGVFPVTGSVNSSLFGVNTGAATTTTLTYNGATQNLTGVTTFDFVFQSIDHLSAPIAVTVTDTKGSTETQTESTTFTGAGTVPFPVGGFTFTPGGGELAFNWGSVTQFSAVIDGPGPGSPIQDLNYRLDIINAEISNPSVPEPCSLAIWALTGIGGLGLVRTCRSRKAA